MLLVWWPPAIFFGGFLLKTAHTHLVPSAEPFTWPVLSESYENHLTESETTILADAATQTLSGSFLRFSPSGERDLVVPSEAAAKKGHYKEQKRLPSVQIFAKSIGVFLALLLSATVVAAGSKHLWVTEAARGGAEPEEETLEGKLPEDADVSIGSPFTADVRVRFAKVRTLLPAAERLASAVRSVEAATLLEGLQNVMKEAEKAAALAGAPGGPTGKALEGSVTDALAMFRKLHLAAIEGVKNIVQADKAVYKFGALEGLDKELFEMVSELEHDENYCVVPLLVKTYDSLRMDAERLRRRSDEQVKRVSTGEEFRDEMDGDLLLKTAVTLELTHAISRSRRHLAAMAESLENDVISGLKQITLRTRGIFMREVEKDLELLHLYAAIKKEVEDRKNEGATAAAAELLADGDAQSMKAHQKEFEEQSEKTSSLLKQLRSQVQLIRKSKTLAVMRSADVQAMNLQSRVYASFQECRAKAASTLEPLEHFHSSVRGLLRDFSVRSYNLFAAKGLSFLRVLKKMHETEEGGSRESTVFINDAIRGKHISETNKLADKVFENLKSANSSLGLVDQATRFDYALDRALDISSKLFSLEKDDYLLNILSLNKRFISFLEKDVSCIASEVESASSRLSSSLSPGFRFNRYEKLGSLFNAAKAALQNATNLREAAAAAAEMRLHAFAVQNFIYGGEEEES